MMMNSNQQKLWYITFKGKELPETRSYSKEGAWNALDIIMSRGRLRILGYEDKKDKLKI